MSNPTITAERSAKGFWKWGGSTAKLRAFALRDFYVGNSFVPRGNPQIKTSCHLALDLEVTEDFELAFPETNLLPYTNTSSDPRARFLIKLYDSKDIERHIYMESCDVNSSLGAIFSWGDLFLYNKQYRRPFGDAFWNASTVAAYVDNKVNGLTSSALKASPSVLGVSRLSEAAADPALPVVVVDNDKRLPASGAPILYADQFAGVNLDDKIIAAMADSRFANGGIIDARGVTADRVLSKNIFAGITDNRPGKLLLPAAPCGVSAVQKPPPNWTIEGVHSGSLAASIANYSGTVLEWTGGSGNAVLWLFNVHDVNVRDVVIDCKSVVNSTGIYIDSNNTPGTTRCAVERFSVVNALQGIQWGSGHVTNYQSDAITLRKFHIMSVVTGAKGITIDSPNAAQTSIIEQGVFQNLHQGIDVAYMDGSLMISSCDFAGLSVNGSVKPIGIKVQRVNDLWIQNSRDEFFGNPVGARFLVITGGDYMQGVITLLCNEMNCGAELQRAAWILSMGNRGTGLAVIVRRGVAGADPSLAKVQSVHDRFALDATLPGEGVSSGRRWDVAGVTLPVPYNSTNYGEVVPSGGSALGAYVGSMAPDIVEATGDREVDYADVGTEKGQFHINTRQGVNGNSAAYTVGANDGGSSGVKDNAQAGLYFESSSAFGTRARIINADNTLTGPKKAVLFDEEGSCAAQGDLEAGRLVRIAGTLTASGTTGNRTIHKGAGSIRIAAGNSSVVLTNNLIDASVIVDADLASNDATAKSVVAVPGSGNCTFYLNAAATGEVEIIWKLVKIV